MLTISKSELAKRLGYTTPSGRIQTIFHTKVMDDQILEHLEMSRPEYKKTRIFSRIQTERLKEVFPKLLRTIDNG